MKDDTQNLLSALLADWHHYCQPRDRSGGYPGRAAGFSQAKSSSQYDWQNNIESDLVDRRLMEGFDAAVHRVREAHPKRPEIFTAIQIEARNLAVRHQVWSSVRLPQCREARAALILEARNLLHKELAKNGVIC